LVFVARESDASETVPIPGGTRHRYRRVTVEDAKRWAELYKSRNSILRIARQEGVDPGTVSSWLRKVGLETIQGKHFVEHLPLKYTPEFIELVLQGPEEIQRFLSDKVWGIVFSENGIIQLKKFCKFVFLYQQGNGINEIAKALESGRSTVADWRDATDQPYLIKCLVAVLGKVIASGCKLAPSVIDSGGNAPKEWFEAPVEITGYQDILRVVERLAPVESAYSRANGFGIPAQSYDQARPELFAYLLGILLGDAGKSGGEQMRFTSMSLDLQLSKKEPSNERLGEFVCLCANSVGVEMKRAMDKSPTGATARAERPTPAFRWMSSRSPIIAWMVRVCLGLNEGELTSVNQVRMGWILSTPSGFRKRFIQGVADSDGTARRYTVEIASMPNSEFITKLMLGLRMPSARTIMEHGLPMRSSVLSVDAAKLPIFNEFVKGYRYMKMKESAKTASSV
jgi:hypothetical protein